MTTPTVLVRKQDGNTGVVRPGVEGILAIVAAAASGTPNEAAAHNDPSLAFTEFSWGPLTDLAAYAMPETGNPCLLVRPTCTTVGAYGAVTKVGGGTAAPAATAATYPYDDFDVVLTFPIAGVLGTTGMTYTYSLDGGKTTSAPQALGTALIVTIPDTGISITLGTATQTIFAGEVVTFTTTRPLATNADLPAALEALRVTSSPFEAVVIDCLADDTTVALIATWLLDLNNHGRFPEVFLTFRPMGAAESEATYATAFGAAFNAAACLDVEVCADEGDMISTLRGIKIARPAGFSVAARSMAVPVGTEPAFVDLGPLTGISITDARGNPKHHNEDKTPTLDTLRAVTLRTITGYEGVYITNSNLLSPSGSDFVYLPHARTMNAAASIAFQRLTKQLSRGVTKNPKPGPAGERYIADHAAQLMEGLVQTALNRALAGQVDDIKFRISRTDDISSNQGAKLTCTVESVSLAYIKKFTVYERFVTQITQ
jgi:hypothetical protein